MEQWSGGVVDLSAKVPEVVREEMERNHQGKMDPDGQENTLAYLWPHLYSHTSIILYH